MDNLNIITPEGTASYPHLQKPDSYMGKEKYDTQLVLDSSKPEDQEFRSKVEAYMEKAKANAIATQQEIVDGLDPKSKNPKVQKQYKNASTILENLKAGEFRGPIEDEFDENDEPTGKFILKTKCNASFKTKKGEVIDLAPKIYDASAELMQVRPDIRGGSRLHVDIDLVPYLAAAVDIGAGVSARLKAVQVIRLSGNGGNDSGGSGFGAKSGFSGQGYVAPETPDVQPEGQADDIDY